MGIVRKRLLMALGLALVGHRVGVAQESGPSGSSVLEPIRREDEPPAEPSAAPPAAVGLGGVSALRIAAYADTQVQTDKGAWEDGFQAARTSDRVVNVSLRTPAAEHLALPVLRDQLEHLRTPAVGGVDVVLYLGDAANNGCKDEIEYLFTALEEQRRALDIPFFFTIGNHDYLGHGNSPDRAERTRLCFDADRTGVGNTKDSLEPAANRAYSKAEVLVRTEMFNRASAAMPGSAWRYVSNFSEVPEGKLPVVIEKACGGDREDQDEYLGCFLAGVATRTRPGGAAGEEIWLVDTSDYGTDKRCLTQGFAGLRGGLSFGPEGTQAHWFFEHAARQPLRGAPRRIVATHYPSADLPGQALEWFGQVLQTYQGVRAGQAAAPDVLWMSAHTHTNHPDARTDGCTDEFSGCKEWNVGSTVDNDPSFALISVNGGGMDLGFHADVKRIHAFQSDDSGKVQVVPPAEAERTCKAMVERLISAPPALRTYNAINGRTQGRSAFGLDRAYRTWWWNDHTNGLAQQNLKLLLEAQEALLTNLTPSLKGPKMDVVEAMRETRACFAWYAARMESGEQEENKGTELDGGAMVMVPRLRIRTRARVDGGDDEKFWTYDGSASTELWWMRAHRIVGGLRLQSSNLMSDDEGQDVTQAEVDLLSYGGVSPVYGLRYAYLLGRFAPDIGDPHVMSANAWQTRPLRADGIRLGVGTKSFRIGGALFNLDREASQYGATLADSRRVVTFALGYCSDGMNYDTPDDVEPGCGMLAPDRYKGLAKKVPRPGDEAASGAGSDTVLVRGYTAAYGHEFDKTLEENLTFGVLFANGNSEFRFQLNADMQWLAPKEGSARGPTQVSLAGGLTKETWSGVDLTVDGQWSSAHDGGSFDPLLGERHQAYPLAISLVPLDVRAATDDRGWIAGRAALAAKFGAFSGDILAGVPVIVRSVAARERLGDSPVAFATGAYGGGSWRLGYFVVEYEHQWSLVEGPAPAALEAAKAVILEAGAHL